jgi:hypothetical protein
MNPFVLNDALSLKLKSERWSGSKNVFRIPQDEIILNIYNESEPEKSVDIFSNTAPVKKLLPVWTWLNFQAPSILKRILYEIRQLIQILASDLSSFENLQVLSNHDKECRGIMFRYISRKDSSTANDWNESFDNLATRFVFFVSKFIDFFKVNWNDS